MQYTSKFIIVHYFIAPSIEWIFRKCAKQTRTRMLMLTNLIQSLTQTTNVPIHN